MTTTPKLKDIPMTGGETCIHHAPINGTHFVIGKKRKDESQEYSYTLYEYDPSLNPKDTKALKSLYSNNSFGNACYELFRIAWGL